MLDLIWQAEFKTEPKVIRQYDDNEQTIEHSFKEVLDRQEDLEFFELRNIYTNILYRVDLKKGTLDITAEGFSSVEADEDILRNKGCKYRLIYFRRVQRFFSTSLQEVDEAIIVYFLGFQYLDENNKNHKRFMKIQSDGRLIIN